MPENGRKQFQKGICKMRRIKNRKLSLAVNVILVVLVLCGWVVMSITASDKFSHRGLDKLRYFTVLSNLLFGLTSAIWSVVLMRLLKGQEASHIRLWLILKYTGTVAIGLTFVVVMAFLGPMYGYDSMFQGGNLFFHLLVPVIGIFEFILLNAEGQLRFSDSYYTLIPIILYGIWYIWNVVTNGARGNDLYGFFKWGNVGAAIIMIVLLLVVWGLAHLFRWAREKVHS